MKKVPDWEWEINNSTSWLGVNRKELFIYKDLLIRLTRKEFLGTYQQTLLGPFWIFLQPVLTVLTFVLVFNKVIGISTNDTPPLLYNLIGITLWNLFADIFLNVAKTFTQNAQIFNKVYFPRIIAAFSALLLQVVMFAIQFILLLCVYAYFITTTQVHFALVGFFCFLQPIITVGLMAFGGGLIFAVLTAKYRDLTALIQLVIRLLMFLCPVFYQLSNVPASIKWVVKLNPLSPQFELFRYAFLGTGDVVFTDLLYSSLVTVILLVSGFLLFNKMNEHLTDVL